MGCSRVASSSIEKAIDNVRYLGNVGDADFETLELILPHCTLEQLMHVEDSTKGRDLSPVTDGLWKKFFERQFGSKNVDVAFERMEKTKVKFSWRQLYEAKVKQQEDKEHKVSSRIRELYKSEEAKKRSRQIIVLRDKNTSTGDKRKLSGDCIRSSGTTKGSLMKKARQEFLNCREVKNIAAMKMEIAVKRIHQGASPATTKTSSRFSNVSSSSCSSAISRKTNAAAKRF